PSPARSDFFQAVDVVAVRLGDLLKLGVVDLYPVALPRQLGFAAAILNGAAGSGIGAGRLGVYRFELLLGVGSKALQVVDERLAEMAGAAIAGRMVSPSTTAANRTGRQLR